MISSDSDSNQGSNVDQRPSKVNPTTNTNKIKILNETILKKANLTARRDYLSKILEDSESNTIINKFQENNSNIKQRDISIANAKNKTFSPTSSHDVNEVKEKGNTTFNKWKHKKHSPENVGFSEDEIPPSNVNKTTKLRINWSQEESPLKNIKSNSDEENDIKSNSDSSREYENKIRKTQISILDSVGKDNQGEKAKINTTVQQRRLEKSESSYCESEANNNFKSRHSLIKQRKHEQISSSSSSDSKDDDLKRKHVKLSHKVKLTFNNDDSDNDKSYNKADVRFEKDYPKTREIKSSSNSSKSTKNISSQSGTSSSGSDTESSINTEGSRQNLENSTTCSSNSDSSSLVKNEKGKLLLKRKHSRTRSSDEEFISKKKQRNSASCAKKVELTESQKLLESFCISKEYQKVSARNQSALDTLNKDDEIYLVQIPKNIDPHLLISKKISFNELSKIKCNDEVYTCSIDFTNKNNITLMNFDKLLDLNLNGIIKIQQYFKFNNCSIDIEAVDDIAEPPSDLKVRHPLFGTNYKEKISLDEDITRKLEEIVEYVNKKKKKKSKNKSKEEITNTEEDNLDIIKLLNERDTQIVDNHKNELITKKKKKKKKKKHKEDKSMSQNMENDTLSMISELFYENISHRNENKNLSRGSCNEHQNNISKSFDEHSKLEQKNKKKSIFDFGEVISQISPTIACEKREKKKRKDRDCTIKAIGEQIQLSQLKVDNKETKQNPSICLDTMNQVIPLDSMLNTHSKKLKKKKRDDVNVANSTMRTSIGVSNSILQLDESCIPRLKKKKKHNHRVSLDNFIDDLIKDVTSGEETTKYKKKKHKYNRSK